VQLPETSSVYEANPVKTTDFQLFSEFSRFTDDTVLTIATAHALMEGMGYAEAYRQFGRRYPGAGYGGSFINWLRIDDAPPYNSWGNGSAMPITGKFRRPLKKMSEAECPGNF
jgi:ADP-ribosylglycohydrolase